MIVHNGQTSRSRTFNKSLVTPWKRVANTLNLADVFKTQEHCWEKYDRKFFSHCCICANYCWIMIMMGVLVAFHHCQLGLIPAFSSCLYYKFTSIACASGASKHHRFSSVLRFPPRVTLSHWRVASRISRENSSATVEVVELLGIRLDNLIQL